MDNRNQKLDFLMMLSMACLMGIILLFLVIGLFRAHSQSEATKELQLLGKENNTYHTANSCILSVPPQDRSRDMYNKCYNLAEEKNHIKVNRFQDR